VAVEDVELSGAPALPEQFDDSPLSSVSDPLVASTPIGFALFDEDLRFMFVNDALAELNGLSASDHVGRLIAEVVPNIANDVITAFTSVLETGTSLTDLVLHGDTRAQPVMRSWSESVHRVEFDPETAGLLAIVVETTEQTRTQGRIRSMIDGVGTFVGLLDVDGTVVEANDYSLNAAGLDLGDVIGRSFWETYWWCHDESVQDRLKAAIGAARAGHAVRYDEVVRLVGDRLITIDFRLVPLVEDGTVIGLVASGTDETERRSATARLRALGEYAQALARAGTTQAVADAAIAHLPAALNAGFANLALLEAETGWVTLIQPSSMPREVADRYRRSSLHSRTPLTDAIRERRIVVVEDVDDYRRRYPDLVADTQAAGLVSTASVPLVIGDEVVGAVGLGWTHRWEDDTIDARLQVVAELTSRSLERTRTADDRSLLVDELRRLLVPSHVDRPGLEIAVRYQAAGRSIGFGGDWIDVIALDGTRTAIVVGDVVGHGVAAAARMTGIRAAINAVIRLETQVGDVFNATEALIEDPDERFQGTALVMVIDVDAASLTYSSAGHPPPLIAERGQPSRPLGSATRPVLGLGAQGPISDVVSIPPGTLLVAYTDGLVESRHEPLDVGIRRVRQVLDQLSPTDGVEEIADALLASAGDSGQLTDDVAMVVIRLST
jgi:PAS domain S-box-containing protein